MKNLISFEGGEGCGKTTLTQALCEYLKNRNIPHILSREPGGTPECEQIRSIIKAGYNFNFNTQLLLFFASRSHLFKEVIKPALVDNKIVLLDRFYDSSRVYQGYCGGIPDEDILKLKEFAVGDAEPQITFFLDISPEDAFKRKGGADIGDAIENKGMEYHRKVREGFLWLCKKEPKRFVKIDATQSKEKVLEDVIAILKKEKVIND